MSRQVVQVDIHEKCICGVHTDMRIRGYGKRITMCRECMREMSESYKRLLEKENGEQMSMKMVFILAMTGLHHSDGMIYIKDNNSWTNNLQEAKLFSELNSQLKELEQDSDCITLSAFQDENGIISLC